MANILVVDDEKKILEIIQIAFTRDGHHVTTAREVSQINKSYLNKYDLILLDIMMPGVDGLSFCRQIRSSVDCPILFVTAKTMESDIVEGLSIGADDYITKPFHIGELRARVNAHLRREHREKQNGFRISGCRFDLIAKEIFYLSGQEEKAIEFTKSEYEICEYLALNHGQIFSKEQILEKIYGYDSDSGTGAIVEHVKNIRAKFAKYELQPIQTVWGIGYRWQE